MKCLHYKCTIAKQMMKRTQDKAKMLLKTNDYMDMFERGKPTWLDHDVWQGLCKENWATYEQKKSQK